MLVSVICPVHNEARYIGALLDSLLLQDYPHELLEILIIDGISTDMTRDKAMPYKSKFPCMEILDNPHQFVPHALNTGIRNSKGEIIVRMDAHSEYPVNYISTLVHYLIELKADNVGGQCITRPGNGTGVALAIAVATSCGFGIGNARFRLHTEEITEVDTVPFGCYRRDVFDRIGLFDEDLSRNQDDELNVRLIKSGGKIFLIPQVKIVYFARETLTKLSRMFYQYGLFKPVVVKKTGTILTARQLVPVIFTLYTVMILPLLVLINSFYLYILLPFFFYIAISLFFTVQLILKQKNLCLLNLPYIFAIIHFSYGSGYLKGIMQMINHDGKSKIKHLQSSR